MTENWEEGTVVFFLPKKSTYFKHGHWSDHGNRDVQRATWAKNTWELFSYVKVMAPVVTETVPTFITIPNIHSRKEVLKSVHITMFWCGCLLEVNQASCNINYRQMPHVLFWPVKVTALLNFFILKLPFFQITWHWCYESEFINYYFEDTAFLNVNFRSLAINTH